MLFRQKSVRIQTDDWLTRTVFTNAEEKINQKLISVLAVGSALRDATSIDRVIEVMSWLQPKLQNQMSLIDMSPANPVEGRFLVRGFYRSVDLGAIETIDQVTEPLMRENLAYDSFAVRSLGVPLFSKNRGCIGGINYDYDRIMAPIQSAHFNLIITAYWNEG
jgi:hypothetical protein